MHVGWDKLFKHLPITDMDIRASRTFDVYMLLMVELFLIVHWKHQRGVMWSVSMTNLLHIKVSIIKIPSYHWPYSSNDYHPPHIGTTIITVCITPLLKITLPINHYYYIYRCVYTEVLTLPSHHGMQYNSVVLIVELGDNKTWVI